MSHSHVNGFARPSNTPEIVRDLKVVVRDVRPAVKNCPQLDFSLLHGTLPDGTEQILREDVIDLRIKFSRLLEKRQELQRAENTLAQEEQRVEKIERKITLHLNTPSKKEELAELQTRLLKVQAQLQERGEPLQKIIGTLADTHARQEQAIEECFAEIQTQLARIGMQQRLQPHSNGNGVAHTYTNGIVHAHTNGVVPKAPVRRKKKPKQEAATEEDSEYADAIWKKIGIAFAGVTGINVAEHMAIQALTIPNGRKKLSSSEEPQE